jgi:hypothetical protein
LAITKVQIISSALLQLGHRPVSSLVDGDDLVNAAESAYDLKLPSVLASGNWRFAIQIQQLNQLTNETVYPWQYTYLLPAGWLKTIRVFPNIYTWDIYNNERIYTDFGGPWWMEYVYQVDVSHLPAHFVDYFVYEIAAYLALSNAQNVQFFSVLEAKRIQMQAIANAIETQNRPQYSQVNFPVIDNRYIGGIIGNSVNM